MTPFWAYMKNLAKDEKYHSPMNSFVNHDGNKTQIKENKQEMLKTILIIYFFQQRKTFSFPIYIYLYLFISIITYIIINIQHNFAIIIIEN